MTSGIGIAGDALRQGRHVIARLNIKPIMAITREGTARHAGIGAWGVFYQVEDGTNG